MAAMVTLFDRLQEKQTLEKERQVETIPRGPLLQPIVPPAAPQSSPTEKMLDWLVKRWPKPSIRVRDILQFGPPAARNRKNAITLAKSLEASGWLLPLATRRHDSREWQIIRGPSQ
jgi:hypothetical protein